MKLFSCEDCCLVENAVNKQQKNSPTINTSFNAGCMSNKSGNEHNFCLTIILKEKMEKNYRTFRQILS